MILVDSTIWIEYLKLNPEYIKEMESLLESRQVITIEPIFAELFYGCRNSKEKEKINSYWKVLPKIKRSENTLIEAANFANKNNYHNLGIGLIDSVLLKVIIENKYLIWTLDKKILNNLDKQYLFK